MLYDSFKGRVLNDSCSECGDCDGFHFRSCSKYKRTEWWETNEAA